MVGDTPTSLISFEAQETTCKIGKTLLNVCHVQKKKKNLLCTEKLSADHRNGEGSLVGPV